MLEEGAKIIVHCLSNPTEDEIGRLVMVLDFIPYCSVVEGVKISFSLPGPKTSKELLPSKSGLHPR